MDAPTLLEQLSASKRILVLGCSGSGKSTLARCLGSILGIELIHLDAHFWQTGWVPTAEPAWRARVASLTARESWIMDGTYERSLDLRIPAADTIIVVESTRLACLWRVVKRKITIDDLRRPDAPPGQPLDRAFLRYIWQYPAVTRPLVYRLIQEHGSHTRLIVLSSPRDVSHFVQRVRSTEQDTAS
jgi:adenylate kinase family enzyme